MGFVPEHDIQRRKCVLKLNRSLYGLKQGSYNWFEKLRKGLLDRQFSQSQVDPCVFMGCGCIVLTRGGTELGGVPKSFSDFGSEGLI